MALPSYLSAEDLAKFRTRFCERLLQMGECSFGDKCQYSHNLLWRRRSPNKHSYEPTMCSEVVLWRGMSGELQTAVTCPDGKSCRYSHSFEEILYHPKVYKVFLCDSANCQVYYCPFAHNASEHQSHEVLETSRHFISSTLGDVKIAELFQEDQISNPITPDFFWSPNHISQSYVTLNPQPLVYHPTKLFIPPVTPTEASGCGWISIGPGVKVESIARAHSASIPADLCRALWTLKGERRHVVAKAVQISRDLNLSLLDFLIQEHILLHSTSPAPEFPDTKQSLLDACISNMEESFHREEPYLVPIRKIVSQGDGVFVIMDRCVASLEGGLPIGLLKKMTVPVIAMRFGEVIKGLAHMHALGVPHTRICPSNILIDSDACWRLGDCFGKYGFLAGITAPPIQGHDLFKSDIWSLGVSFIYSLVITMDHPNDNLFNPHEEIPYLASLSGFVDKFKAWNCPTTISPPLDSRQQGQHGFGLVIDLLMRMTQSEDRPSAKELLTCPLFWGLTEIKSFAMWLMEVNEFSNIIECFMDYEISIEARDARLIADSVEAVAKVTGQKQVGISSCVLNKIICCENRDDVNSNNVVDSTKVTESIAIKVTCMQLGLSIPSLSDSDILQICEKYPTWMIRVFDAWRIIKKNPTVEDFKNRYGQSLAEDNLGFLHETSIDVERAREYYSSVSSAMQGKELVLMGSFLDQMLDLGRSTSNASIIPRVPSASEVAHGKHAPILDIQTPLVGDEVSNFTTPTSDSAWDYAIYCPSWPANKVDEHQARFWI